MAWSKPTANKPNLGVPVVLLLMVSTVMMAVLTFVAARSLDRSAEASAKQLAQSLLTKSRLDLAKVVRDIGQLYQLRPRRSNAGGPIDEARELGDDLGHTFDIASSWIIGAGDTTTYGWIEGKATTVDAFQVMPSGLDRLTRLARTSVDGTAVGAHGLLLFNGNIHVAAAIALQRSAKADEAARGALRPVLVVTRALDHEQLSVLESVYFLSSVKLTSETLPEAEVVLRLHNPVGDTIGYLMLDISPPGTVLLRQVWPAVASAFASMLLLAGLFVRRVERVRLQTVHLEETLDRERELGQLKSRFVNMVSHEIRTPLTTIRTATDLLTGYGQQMKEGDREAEIEAIQHEVGVISDLVEDVLAIGRTEGEAFELRPRQLDLEALCREIWLTLERSRDRKQAIEMDIDPRVREVALDPTLLRPILTNILGNAIKFSPEATPVRVELRIVEGEVVIRVRDQGIGIPADQREAIFAPFHRASNVGAISGSGLGLTITKQSVERHGGTLELSSHEGKGTEVLVRLPLAA